MWSVKTIFILLLSIHLILSAELNCSRHPELSYIQCELSEKVNNSDVVIIDSYKSNERFDSDEKNDVVVSYKNLGLSLPRGIGKIFKNLISFDVSASSVALVERICFENMENLKDLRLFYNSIEELPSDAFADLPQLEILNLAKNQLKSIPDDLFANNLKLKILRLNENQLATIEANAFKSNSQLKELSLQRNLITRVTFDFTALNNIVVLDLSANIGSCNVRFDKSNKNELNLNEIQMVIESKCNG